MLVGFPPTVKLNIRQNFERLKKASAGNGICSPCPRFVCASVVVGARRDFDVVVEFDDLNNKNGSKFCRVLRTLNITFYDHNQYSFVVT
jgi:hypothetical protein